MWADSRTSSPRGKTGHFCPWEIPHRDPYLSHLFQLSPVQPVVLTPVSIDPHCITVSPSWDIWALKDSMSTCKPWWTRSLALGWSTEPPPSTIVVLFFLCHTECAVQLKAELLEIWAFPRHAQGNKPLSNYVGFPHIYVNASTTYIWFKFTVWKGMESKDTGSDYLFLGLFSSFHHYKGWIFILLVCLEFSLCTGFSSHFPCAVLPSLEPWWLMKCQE